MQFDLFAEPPAQRPAVFDHLVITEHAVGNPARLRGYMARATGVMVFFVVPAGQFERYTQEQRDEMRQRFEQRISEK